MKMTAYGGKTQEMFYKEAVRLFGPLQLPPARLMLRPGTSSKLFDVYDSLRSQWVALTPEEWVRQHFVKYMVSQLGYSEHRISNEVALRLNGMVRRADTVVYDDRLTPQVVVEYKAPEIGLTQRVVEQILRYNLVLGAKGLMVTNGLDVFSLTVEDESTRIFRGVIPADLFRQ